MEKMRKRPAGKCRGVGSAPPEVPLVAPLTVGSPPVLGRLLEVCELLTFMSSAGLQKKILILASELMIRDEDRIVA